MFQSNKIHDNVLHLNFAPNYTSDVENTNDIENTNYSFQFWDNSSQDLKEEHLHAYNNNYVSESFSISEWNLYGSSRLGTRSADKTTDVIFLASRNYNWINNTVTNEYIAPTASFTYKKYRLLGAKTFELTNHLGNVITAISDRKLMLQDDQNLGYIHHYKPEILSIGEQYAFGMSMPERSFNVEKYRYGMNTQEKDDDIYEGAFTAEYWEYDSRVGRRWNIDPLFKEWESPFACFANNPIFFVDVLGLNPTGNDSDKNDKPNASANGAKGNGVYKGEANLPKYEYSYKRTFKDKLRSFFKYKAKEVVNRLANGITKVVKNAGKAIVNGLRKIEKVFEGTGGYLMTDENAKGSNNGSPGLPSKEWDVTGFLLRPIPGVYHLSFAPAAKPGGAYPAEILQHQFKTVNDLQDAVGQPCDPALEAYTKEKAQKDVLKSKSVLKYEKIGVQFLDSNGILSGTVIPINPRNKVLLQNAKDGLIDISKVDSNDEKP